MASAAPSAPEARCPAPPAPEDPDLLYECSPSPARSATAPDELPPALELSGLTCSRRLGWVAKRSGESFLEGACAQPLAPTSAFAHPIQPINPSTPLSAHPTFPSLFHSPHHPISHPISLVIPFTDPLIATLRASRPPHPTVCTSAPPPSGAHSHPLPLSPKIKNRRSRSAFAIAIVGTMLSGAALRDS